MKKENKMLENKLNEYCKIVNLHVNQKGFWDAKNASVNQVDGLVISDGSSLYKHTYNAFITQKIMLIVSELSEAVEALRKDNFGTEKKDTFEDEIADSLLRTFDLCAELGIDIEKQLLWKMEFNKSRENMHGKNF